MAAHGRTPEGVFSNASPFALLVDAANAQSRGEEGRQMAAALEESQRSASENHHAAAAAAAAARQQHNFGEFELQEALQREALQRRAALMALGGGGGGAGGGYPGGLAPQEAEYLQQLRLEALVQQRRQETLAQLALAQESGMSQDIHALLQAQQLRQAALMRQEMLGGGGLPPGYEQFGNFGGHFGGQEENAYLQHLLEEREKQAKLAALASAGGMNIAGFSGLENSAGLAAERTKIGPDSVSSALEKKAAAREPEIANNMDNGSKTTVLPCRARGMPMDHNVKTAYFVIDEDVKHGTELVCSYFACRNVGIKFRYCTHCKLPVAKRNFCKRHKHTGKIAPGNMVKGLDMNADDESSSEGSESEMFKNTASSMPSSSGVGKGISLQAKPKTKVDNEADSKSRAQAGKPKKSHEKKTNAAKSVTKTKVVRAKKRTLQISADYAMKQLLNQGIDELALTGTPPGHLSSEETKKFTETRMEKWDALLNKRPRYDRDAMLFWVQDVLATSDFDTPLEDEEVPDKAEGTTVDKDEEETPVVKDSDKELSKGDLPDDEAIESNEIQKQADEDPDKENAVAAVAPQETGKANGASKEDSVVHDEPMEECKADDTQGNDEASDSVLEKEDATNAARDETDASADVPMQDEAENPIEEKPEEKMKGKIEDNVEDVGTAAASSEKVDENCDNETHNEADKTTQGKNGDNDSVADAGTADKEAQPSETEDNQVSSPAATEKETQSSQVKQRKESPTVAEEVKKGGKKALVARRELDDLKEENEKQGRFEKDTKNANDKGDSDVQKQKVDSDATKREKQNEDVKTEDNNEKEEEKAEDDKNDNDDDDDEEEEDAEEERDDDSRNQSGTEEMNESKAKSDSDDASTSSEDSVDLRANKRR